MGLVTVIVDNKADDTSSSSSSYSYSFAPRDVVHRGGSSSGTYALLSQNLGISYIRKYNGCVNAAIRADDRDWAVAMMVRMDGRE